MANIKSNVNCLLGTYAQNAFYLTSWFITESLVPDCAVSCTEVQHKHIIRFLMKNCLQMMKEHTSECRLTEFIPHFLLGRAPVRSVIAVASGSFSGREKTSNICMSNWNISCHPNLLMQHPNFSDISFTPN